MGSTTEEKSDAFEHNEQSAPIHSVIEEDTPVPKGYWTSFRFLGSLAAIILLANNLFIGYAMPANILNVINADIGPDPNIYLASLVNTLLKGVGLLLVGSISDVLGRRYFIVGGQICGFIGACVAATANNVNTLIGANVLIGMGGATQVLYPLLIHEIVPNKWRGAAQAGVTAAVFPTMGLGPAFVRMMVEYDLGWRWAYWLNVITTGTSVFLFLFCYFPPNFEQLQRGLTKTQQVRQIDYLGFSLYAGGLICLLLGMGWGGRQYAWSDPPVIATLVVGIVVLLAFGLYEAYAPLSSPLMPMYLFKNRNYVVAVVVGCVGQMSWYALNVIWPTQITNLYTTDNLLIGWMSCTQGAALAAGEIIAGPFCKGGMRIKLQMFLSVIGLTIFCGIMALSNEDRQDLAIAMTIMIGLFVGWIELTAIVIAGLVIPPEHIGSGSAFFASTRAVTGTIATSIYVAIQTNTYSSELPGKVRSAAESAGLDSDRIPDIIDAIRTGTVAALDEIPDLSSSVRSAILDGVKAAYTKSYSTVYLSSLAFGGVALISVFFATNEMDDYFTSFLNKTVDAPHIEAELKGDVEKAKRAEAQDE